MVARQVTPRFGLGNRILVMRAHEQASQKSSRHLSAVGHLRVSLPRAAITTEMPDYSPLRRGIPPGRDGTRPRRGVAPGWSAQLDRLAAIRRFDWAVEFFRAWPQPELVLAAL